jgi:hypothetical protein
MWKDQIFSFMDSVSCQTCDIRYRLVANMWKNDYEHAPEKFKSYLKSHNIETALHGKNRRTFNKICSVFRMYREIPIMTVDDDNVYRKDAIQGMWNSHMKYPNLIIGGAGVITEWAKDETGKWKDNTPIKIRPGTLQTDIELVNDEKKKQKFRCYGCSGILYPSRFFEDMTINDIDEHILKHANPIKWSDDWFLYEYGNKHDVKWMVAEKNCADWDSPIEHHLPMAHDETAHTWMKD